MSRPAGWMACVVVALASAGPVLAEEPPFDYFRNSFNVVGLKDYDQAARVTPENDILLAAKGKRGEGVTYEGRLRLRFGRALTPLSAPGQVVPRGLAAGDATDGKRRAGPLRLRTGHALATVQDWRRAFDCDRGPELPRVGDGSCVTNAGSERHAKLQAEHRPRRWRPGRETRLTRSSQQVRPGHLRVPFWPVDDSAAFDRKMRTCGSSGRRSIEGPDGRRRQDRGPVPKVQEALLAAHVCQR